MCGNGFPQKQGLYDPRFERENCGVGFIAHKYGEKSHGILKQALTILKKLKHRGAVGADASTGDGSGIMMQIPHMFFQKEMREKINLKEGDYAVGIVFVPQEPTARLFCEGVIETVLKEEGQKLLGWREVPIDEKACGALAKATRPVILQMFIDRNHQSKDQFERKLLMIRKQIQKRIRDLRKPYTESFYICSLSQDTIVYKGLILGHALDAFYIDLKDKSFKTSIAIVHERYSTNTFPSWKLAQPFRYLAHNGEINTIQGNRNWMNAREGVMESKVFLEELNKVLPIIEPEGSDSASLDNALEMFIHNGHSMEEAFMMLMPQAWQNDEDMDEDIKGFYEYHARIIEPWDGPATVAFTDGKKVGVILDRNGLRPAPYIITKQDVIIMSSEIGVANVLEKDILYKGRIESGNMMIVDTQKGQILVDEVIKKQASQKKPFKEWVSKNKITLEQIHKPFEVREMKEEILATKKRVFGYTKEEIEKIIGYMATNGKEPIGSMGMDTPIAVLSEKPQLLFNYFKQTFAQVTNPPIDPVREKMVMSLMQFIGGHGKLLDEIETETDRKYIVLDQPILTNGQIEDLKHMHDEHLHATVIPITFEMDREDGLKQALESLCKRAEESVLEGYNILILSDRNIGRYHAPIESLLALSTVHHHLINKKLRTSIDIIVECGDARDVMHMALLMGYGATAINPYMVYEIIREMTKNEKYKELKCFKTAFSKYCAAISSGLLKIISRIGISTLQSYKGAQIFQSIGLSHEVVEKYFKDTPWTISSMSLKEIKEQILTRHMKGYDEVLKHKEEVGGEWLEHKEGEKHILHKKLVMTLREACMENKDVSYKQYTEMIHQENKKLTLRGLLTFKERESIPLKEVESVEDILKRFTVAGMSFGSLSKEAHETIAIAMNRIGATSNSGEGGEDIKRYNIRDNGDDPKSYVKQVASARFGVTAHYLSQCNEIQIKMAQGAKPGEGGHLPGQKVTEEIARVRHALEGIDLISPPPHHDIYSIEDLAQLIFDLKNVNPLTEINVKLVSQLGIGTVAAGVAKAHADKVVVSGHDGGTGASPMSSMKYVGLPWEIGLAQTQQTLLLNNLRSRIKVQVDGKIRSGQDVVIAALLGAEEYGFATTALIALGCRMCRQCHKNKCSVGIATQDPSLRKRFKGKPEYLIQYMIYVAKEVRQIMASLGFKRIEDMIGRVDVLKQKKVDKNIDLSSILYRPQLPSRIIDKCVIKQDHGIDKVMDKNIMKLGKEFLEKGKKQVLYFSIENTDRAVGSMLSGEIAKRYGHEGLKEDTLILNFKGSAGQSFGAFGMKGVTMVLKGDSNDYLGKGLCGAKIIVKPSKAATFCAQENMIAGNTLLYGATSGEVYICGKVGQRFAVRNSGAVAVVEGVGNHGCEYMTGGKVIILGSVGRNFAAGMSGGMVYVLDDESKLRKHCNEEMVKINYLSNEDLETLKILIKKHFDYTESKKAQKILKEWDQYKNQFLKVCSPIYEEKIKQKNR